MTVTGYTRQSSCHDVPEQVEWLDIEVVRDEHYKQNTVYRSWQDILAGDDIANIGSSPPRPLGDPDTG